MTDVTGAFPGERIGRQAILRAKGLRPGAWLRQEEVAQIAGDPATRLTPCLVRFGGCRLICAAQDVEKIIAALEAAGDYVRDVSLSQAELLR